MAERKVPDREGLEFGVSGVNAALDLVVDLGEADGHLAAARSGRGHDDQRLFGLDEIVLSVALVGYYQLDVRGISGDRIVAVHLHAQVLELLLEGQSGWLALEAGHDDSVDLEAEMTEDVGEAQHVGVVGDPDVAPLLALFDVAGIDDDDHFGLILELEQHLHLAVRLEAGENPRRVVVVIELHAEFEVELSSESAYPLAYLFRLKPEIHVVVESDPLACIHSDHRPRRAPAGVKRRAAPVNKNI